MSLLLFLIVLLLLFWNIRLRRRLREPSPPPSQPAGQDPRDLDIGTSSVVSVNAAVAGALKGFEDYGLAKRADWAPLLAPPSVPRAPILVQRLDATESSRGYYYLVPIGPTDDNVSAVVRVDAVSGRYLEASPFLSHGDKKPWGTMMANWRSETITRRKIAGRTFERRNYQGSVVADARGVGVHPAFVWKPCVESRSPFFPFRLVTIGDQQRYVRIDGKEFESLTDLGPGSLVFKKDDDRSI
ncbi:MAG TPA: hypothetical protein VES67_03100 [Vicinamibacterales bacterium]|nr:hypothetical protein [Vicinamibacterales bacterium]